MNEETKQHPPEKEAFARIMEVIEYGKSFKWEEVCESLSVDLEDITGERDWEFTGPWLRLCKMLEQEGYFVTERGMNGEGFRVLSREEMADHVKSKEIRAANASLERSLSLSKVPREGLEDFEVKKLDHWEEKSALNGAISKALLRKRKLPSPEMVIKSIKQIA